MMLKPWEQLPEDMRCEEVRPYYVYLSHKRISMIAKRIFDVVFSVVLLVLLSPLILGLGIWIKIDSKGSIVFKQQRVTQYGRKFYIYKFRTMVQEAERIGTQVTIRNDSRITRAGRIIRSYRLDEILQLINILKGDMTFVGTRPESVKYVKQYTDEMKATLLLRAGVTSKASIEYKDEDSLLFNADDADYVYVNKVLPAKMEYNLKEIYQFSLHHDLKVMLQTVGAVFIQR